MENKEEKRRAFYTALDITSHIVLSLALAFIFYKMTGGWLWPVLAVAGGVLIDLDHLLDYFLYYGFKIDVRGFFLHKYIKRGTVYSLFHSWELIAIIWLLGIVYDFCIPLAAGMTLHLATDLIYSYTRRPLRTFFTYRLIKGFRLDKMDPEEHKKIQEGKV